jgi:hypothetical protein
MVLNELIGPWKDANSEPQKEFSLKKMLSRVKVSGFRHVARIVPGAP